MHDDVSVFISPGQPKQRHEIQAVEKAIGMPIAELGRKVATIVSLAAKIDVGSSDDQTASDFAGLLSGGRKKTPSLKLALFFAQGLKDWPLAPS